MMKKVDVLRYLLMLMIIIGPLMTSGNHAHGQLPVKGKQDARIVLRIWGAGGEDRSASPLLGVLIKLETDYRKSHPEVTFTHHLTGNDSALGSLYVGAADLVLMDREPSYIELDGYQQMIKGEKPFEIGVMRGGVHSGEPGSPLVVVVSSSNPLAQLTMAELASIFDAEHQSQTNQVRTWGDLGLTAKWKNEPLHLYGFGIESGEAMTFSKIAMAGDRRWVCGYKEMKPRSSTDNVAEDVAKAVARDTHAIGLTTFDAVTTGTKVVAIMDAAGVGWVPTRESLASGQYPFGRTLFALTKMKKDGHPEDKARGFLNYLLGPQAQTIIAADAAYVPLAENLIAHERETLR